MSRYLTPFKIALLKLITVYSDGMVPSSASTSILSFIVSYLLPVYPISKEPDRDTPQENFIFSVERLQRATVVHSSAIPGRTVWDLLLNSLWAINSLDALHAFFDDLSSLLDQSVEDGPARTDELDLHPPKRMLLSRSSPFGTFVRRAQLEFTRLQFHDGISLWKALVLFRNPSLQFWKRRNPGAGSHTFDSNLQKDSIDVGRRLGGLIYDDLNDNTFKGAQTSIDDMEKLLDYQVSRMQRAFPQDLVCITLRADRLTGFGNRVPQAVRAQLRTMAKPGATIPVITYYMRYIHFSQPSYNLIAWQVS